MERNFTPSALKRLKRAFALLCVFLLAQASGSVASVSRQSSFQELPFDGKHDFVQINQKGTLLAVVHGGNFGGADGYTGTSVEVWSLDAHLKPSKIVFSDRRKVAFSPRVQWVGNSLLYSFIEGMTKKRFDEQLSYDLLETVKHVKGRLWKAETQTVRDFLPAREEFIVPINRLQKIIVINPLEPLVNGVVARVRRNQGIRTDFVETWGVPAWIYSVTTGKLLRKLNLPVRTPRLGRDSGFIPLFASADGKTLFAVTDTDDPWRKTPGPLTPYHFLIAIDLTTGKITRLTSNDEPDALWCFDHRFFGLALPARVGDSQVVCALDARERNRSYRFQFYTNSGKLIKEIVADDRIVQRAQLPKEALILTWDNKGNALLQTDSAIWFYDTNIQQCRKLVQDFAVTDIFGRSETNLFLVRAQHTRNQYERSYKNSNYVWALIQTDNWNQAEETATLRHQTQ